VNAMCMRCPWPHFKGPASTAQIDIVAIPIDLFFGETPISGKNPYFQKFADIHFRKKRNIVQEILLPERHPVINKL